MRQIAIMLIVLIHFLWIALFVACLPVILVTPSLKIYVWIFVIINLFAWTFLKTDCLFTIIENRLRGEDKPKKFVARYINPHIGGILNARRIHALIALYIIVMILATILK